MGGAPNFPLSEPNKSGRTGNDSSAVGPEVPGLLGSVLSDGAAFTRDEEAPVAAVAFLRFTLEGTNAVASFLKSRSSGAAKTVADIKFAVSRSAMGFGGSDADAGGGGTTDVGLEGRAECAAAR